MKKKLIQEQDRKVIDIEVKSLDGAKSLHRAISIIKAVAFYEQTGARMTKLAKKVNLPTSTVHRILCVLVSEDLIEYDDNSKKYHLGYGLYALGEKARKFDIRKTFHTALKNVSERTEETAYLIIRSGNDAYCIDRIVGSYTVQVLTFEIGQRRPLGIGGGSLAILSSLPDEMCESIIKANTYLYPEFMGRTADEIRKMVKKTRRDGFALSKKNIDADTIGIGVPIKNEQGKVLGAISVAGINSRMKPDRRHKIVEIIRSEIERTG
jgi:DNA-binding IclR family transcriptional regulator